MKKVVGNEDASELVRQQSEEFTIIHNPDHVFPSTEVVPLAPRVTSARENMQAVVMHMEGIVSNAEQLCFHSLEHMLRQISGRFTRESWHGLDPLLDHPNLIESNPVANVEFLVNRYNNYIKREFFVEAYFYSALWTLIKGFDENQKKEVRADLATLGCRDLLKDEKLDEFISKGEFGKYNAHLITNYFLHKYGESFKIINYNSTVKAALDIYYQRYQEILQLLKSGKGSETALNIPGDGRSFIEPMPGFAIFLALIKGWLGEDVKYVFDELKTDLEKKHGASFHKVDIDIVKNKLITISKSFETNPLKTAIVSSAIFQEAEIVIEEIFRIISMQAEQWKLPSEKKNFIKDKFKNYLNALDFFVTGSDSGGMRLKPHRDLYSIALYQLGIPRMKFQEVIGFDNTESGIIALRAAGIGFCVALTSGRAQVFESSLPSYVISGGIPEVLLYHNLFMK